MLTQAQARARIDGILKGYQSAFAPAASLLPAALTTGKLYEAWVLCVLLERMKLNEGYAIVLRNSTRVTLKTSGGPINRAYPYFELTAVGLPKLEVWTDVEFMAMSHALRGATGSVTRGDFHELDIVVVEVGTKDRPRHDEIVIGVECKNTGYSKGLLRGILGVRRELSLLTGPVPTRFQGWPRPSVPANPPSCLLVYSTDPSVTSYSDPGSIFGIDFVYEPVA